MDTVEDAHGLIHVGRAIAGDTLGHFTARAITLLCLLLDQTKLAKASVEDATQGWPTTAGHRL